MAHPEAHREVPACCAKCWSLPMCIMARLPLPRPCVNTHARVWGKHVRVCKCASGGKKEFVCLLKYACFCVCACGAGGGAGEGCISNTGLLGYVGAVLGKHKYHLALVHARCSRLGTQGRHGLPTRHMSPPAFSRVPDHHGEGTHVRAENGDHMDALAAELMDLLQVRMPLGARVHKPQLGVDDGAVAVEAAIDFADGTEEAAADRMVQDIREAAMRGALFSSGFISRHQVVSDQQQTICPDMSLGDEGGRGAAAVAGRQRASLLVWARAPL